jgi:tRNA-dihydrouridine synthase
MVLAPMDDVADTVFRQIIQELAPADLYFTEFVNVDGLNSPGRSNLIKKLRFSENENKLVAQLWGKTPENFYEIARQIADGTIAKEVGLPKGHNFVGVDLNMGCPQKNEVSGGTCAALINNRPLAKEIIDATKKGLGGSLPLSVKTRIGYNEIDMTWIEFLLKQDIDMISIHGRTKKEMSKVPAHWDQINIARQIRDKIAPNTLIVGNGDVKDRRHGLELASQYKLDGIMIGRGVLNDPLAFSNDNNWQTFSTVQKLDLYLKHLRLFVETWKDNEKPIHTINRFCKLYISGFDGAKEFREKIMSMKDVNKIIEEVKAYKTGNYATAVYST